MRSAFFAVILILTAATSAHVAGQHQPSQREAAIRAWFESGTAAWNRGDLDAYLAGYWDSDRTRLPSGGRVIRGKKVIAAMYRSRFPSPEQMGRFAVTSLEVQELSGTDALVF